MDKQEFISMLLPGANEGYRIYGVLPSLTISQAILESGWGQHAPGNNLFGVKWFEGCGYDYLPLDTQEYINGEWIAAKEKFKKYNDYSESIKDHAELFRYERYRQVIEAPNYVDACKAVQACGYATDPEYANKLIQIIEENNLQQYDVSEQDTQPTTPEEAINYLAEKGRITDKEWHYTLLKVVRNQEFIYIKWAEDVRKLEGLS